jgi:F-type H+-transporting ATPase subunit delta
LGLRTVLASPAVVPNQKKALVAALAARLGLAAVTQNFLRVVIDHRRLALLDEMIEAFEKILDERRGIVRAALASPQPVEPDQQSLLAARLASVTGRQVRLNVSVDPALLGGAVARIGSTVYDGSLRGRLRALERRLAQE